MSGKDVEALQRFLNHHLGLPLTPLDPDGIFGSRTRERVIEFQTRNRVYPMRMPFPPDYPREFRQPLKVDGIVGQHTLRVLIDLRTVYSPEESSFRPVTEERTVRAGVRSFGDPQPSPTPPSPPSRTFQMVQLQPGTQVNLDPWSASPFLFTAQYMLWPRTTADRISS